jgi:hypothetical protein
VAAVHAASSRSSSRRRPHYAIFSKHPKKTEFMPTVQQCAPALYNTQFRRQFSALKELISMLPASLSGWDTSRQIYIHRAVFADSWHNLPAGNVNKPQAIEFSTTANISVSCIFKIEK